MKEICFATNNQHKIEEVRAIIGSDFRILSLREIGCHEELPETGETLEANSRQKAEYVFSKYNIPCFADDSGLEVAALNWAPGVFSARYAGEQRNDNDNIDLLLRNMSDSEDRVARFRTVITLIGMQGVHAFEGIIEGTITRERRGNGGFGYDPVFIPDGYDVTFAQMSPAQKNAISHRAVAVQKLAVFLKKNWVGAS